MKPLKKVGLVLMVLVGILAISLAVFAYTLKPDYEGEKKLANLSKEVTIHYDTYGIPHIYGKNNQDAFRALGYVHAQDRLWQMELLRRIGKGGLSEIFGEATVERTNSFWLWVLMRLQLKRCPNWTWTQKRFNFPWHTSMVSTNL